MKQQTILISALAVLSIAGISYAGFSATQGKTTALVPIVSGDNGHVDGVTGSASDLILAGNAEGDGQVRGQGGQQQGGGQGGFGGGGQRQGGPGQDGQGGPGGQMRMPANPPMALLMDPKVKAELKLTDEQIQKIQDGIRELMPQGGPGGPPPGDGGGQGGFGGGGQGGQRQGGGQGQGGVGGGQRQGGGQGGGQGQAGGGNGQAGPRNGGGQGQGGVQMRGQDPEMMAKMDAVLKANMNDNQFNRYKQLELQFSGARALLSPAVSEKLALSEEQKQQIMEIMRSQRRGPGGQGGFGGGGAGGGQRQGGGQGQAGGGQRQGGGGQGGFGGGQQGGPGEPPTPPTPEEIKKMEDELNAKVLAVLTDSQRSKWNAMLGAKFEFSPRPPQQVRGGFGGSGQGGQGGPGGRGGNGGNGGGGGDTEEVSLVF